MDGTSLKPDYEALRAADPDGMYIEPLSCYPYMMTVENASEAITLYLREGRLKGVKSGRAWRIPKCRFIEFLYKNENPRS
jgi:hypothetical protein